MSDAILKIDKYLESQREAAVVSLRQLLKIASISTQPSLATDVRMAARWTQLYLQNVGVPAEVWDTGGAPAVYAEHLEAGPGAPTLLIYGHYDVQPTGDLAQWTSPPFEPRVDDTGRIFARGSADDKGQFFLQILAVEAWLKTAGKLPVNVKILIEGEEEIGSPNLVPTLEKNRERLKCDMVVVSDTPLWAPDRPAISLGTRGITGLEIKIIGPNRDLHSGMYGGSVPNPIAVLSRVLSQLHDDRGRVNVPTFYDGVQPIPQDLRDEWKRLDAEVQRDARTLETSLTGEEGFNTVERRWLRPTLEFNGITGGYQGPGSNTIVPSLASAKITCRLVPGQDPARIQKLLRDHLHSLVPAGMKVEFTLRKSDRAPPYSIDPNHPALKAAATVMQDVYGVPPVRVREGVSLPILPAFKNILGADTIMLGFCDPQCQAHSFDEFFDTKDLIRGARTVARFLKVVAT